MKKFYAIILAFTAALLAITAAYFSVFGLSKLFVGATISVIVMAATLEFAKVVTVSFLHQYWKKISKGLKAYLLFGIIVLMIITSMGIYGFLSNAYSKVSIDLEKMGGNVELLDKRIEIKKEEKERLDEQITTKNERIVSLTNLRKGQEARLDSLYERGWTNAAKKTETIISQADENISKLNIDVNNISTKIENLNDSIAKYETSKLGIGNSDVAAEVGPLKYISKLTGASMDTVVNWLTLLLIIVFDPLSIALIVATSGMVKLVKEEKKLKEIEEKKEAFKKKVQYISDEHGNFKLEEQKSETKEENISTEENVVDTKVEEIVSTKEVVVEEEKNNETIVEIPEKNAIFNIKQDTVADGIFTATTSNNKIEKIDEDVLKKQSLYLKLLDILYNSGINKTGDEIPVYSEFKKTIDNKLTEINDKEIKDFLIICNLFKITEFKENSGYFVKNYEEATYLISKI